MRLKMTWALLLLSFTLVNLAINAFEVSYDSRAITIDGKRKVLFSGSIHYPRSTAEVRVLCIISCLYFLLNFKNLIHLINVYDYAFMKAI